MRDELSFVERVQRDLSGVRWPEPAEIRARARRRSRRAAFVAGVAVVATLSAAAAVVGRPVAYAPASEPPVVSAPVPTPVTPPPRVEVPLAALVQQSDLPVRTDLQLGEPGLGGTVDTGLGLDRCSGDPQTEAWVSRSQTLLRRSSGGRLDDIVVTQDLHRLRGDEATRFLQQVRRQVAACREWLEVRSVEHEGRAVTLESTHRWDTPRVDFAGDEALLLRHSASSDRDRATGTDYGEPTQDQHVVLRVGDLVTVLFMRDAGEAELVRLAEKAARRMCVAANPPC